MAKCAAPREWESGDFAISKTVVREGDVSKVLPRFNATGSLRLRLKSTAQQTSGEGTDDGGKDLDDVAHRLALQTSALLNAGGQSADGAPASVEFRIGRSVHDVDLLIEELAMSMFPGEECEATLRVALSGGEWLILEVEAVLETLENSKPVYELGSSEKLALAEEDYLQGVDLFKGNEGHHLKAAFRFFRRSATLCQFVMEEVKAGKSVQTAKSDSVQAEVATSAEDKEVLASASDLWQRCLSNLTACHFNWKNNRYVISMVTKLLEEGLFEDDHPLRVKGLYRRGVALGQRGDYEKAVDDLEAALTADPNCAAARRQVQHVREMWRKSDLQLGNNLKKMFQ